MSKKIVKKVVDLDKRPICDACGGSGMANEDKVCPVCKGTGRKEV